MGNQGSGRRPDARRRARARRLRARGLTLAEVAQALGVSRQRAHQLLRDKPRLSRRRPVPCAGCGQSLGPAARPEDAAEGLCPPCLARRPGAPLAVRARSLRLAAGLTLAALARKAGVGEQTPSRLERGTGRPWRETLRKVAKALGVGVAELDPLRG
jgi:transcriptional regulator with XRE-family HTH domain